MKMTDILYCNYCGWKLITRSLKQLDIKCIEIDGIKKFKCPSCGRLISSKKITDVQKELDNKIKKEKYLEDYKSWIEEIVNKEPNDE